MGFTPAFTGAAILPSSIQLGEAVAISMLQDRAATYAENFTVSFEKITDHRNHLQPRIPPGPRQASSLGGLLPARVG